MDTEDAYDNTTFESICKAAKDRWVERDVVR